MVRKSLNPWGSPSSAVLLTLSWLLLSSLLDVFLCLNTSQHRGELLAAFHLWFPAFFWWFPTCSQLSLWKLRHLTSCFSLLWWNLKARGTTASPASCVAQPEMCPGWSWLDKVSWSHRRSSQLQDCEPGCGNMAGDIVLEIPKQSISGTVALACQLPGERPYPSFNQPLLPSVPGQSCLANTCQHAHTHTGIPTCVREPHVVKQPLNLIVISVLNHTRRVLE